MIKELMWPELVAAVAAPTAPCGACLMTSGDALLTDIATITLLLGCHTPGDGAP